MVQRPQIVIYGIEFLLALIAVFTVWSQVGGQGHLDYMAWYWKAGIGLPASFAAVRLTMAFASEGPRRRRHILTWMAVLLALSVGAGLVTYYYHLNEPQDENEDDAGTVTRTAAWNGCRGVHYHLRFHRAWS